MRIAQISDTHISLDFPSRIADLERCVTQINTLPHLPDLVIHTGDITHDGLAEQYAMASKHLGALKVPWFVMVGNKDNRQEVRKAFSEDHFPRQDTPFVQYAVDQFELRIVCIDTLCETSNKGELCGQRLEDLERLLSVAPASPTAIFMHHPPFDVPVAPDPFQFVSRDEANACLELLAHYPSIRGLFCGHVHRPYETMIEHIPAHVMTAGALDLRFGETKPISSDAPLYRLHEFDDGGLNSD